MSIKEKIEEIIKDKSNYVYALVLFYVIGFFINSIPNAYYFSYLPIREFKLLNYLASAIWWLTALSLVYLSFLITKKLSKRFYWILFKKEKHLGTLYLSILALFPFVAILYFVVSFVFIKHDTIFHFIKLPFSFSTYTYQISRLIEFGVNTNFLLFYGSSILIIVSFDKDISRIRKFLAIIVIALNIITFSHTAYTKIPKSIGGGKMTTISMCFKKDYIPNDLKNIIINQPYYAYLVDEDDFSYYVVFRSDVRTHKLFSRNYQEWRLRRNPYVIPRENLVYLKIHN